MTFAYLSGLKCDARDEDGVRYDPREQLVKWTDNIPFRYEVNTHQYEATLTTQLNCPLELYDRQNLDGCIDVLLPDKLLSGLNLAYFDAVGREVDLTVERKTTVKIQFNQIALDEIFRRREFKSTRKLIFEGISVELEQLGAIQRILSNLGLARVRMQLAQFRWDPSWENMSTHQVLDRSREYLITGSTPNGMNVALRISGELSPSKSFASNGNIFKPVDGGQMAIQIDGSVTGDFEDAQQLSILLNKIQFRLNDRFSPIIGHSGEQVGFTRR